MPKRIAELRSAVTAKERDLARAISRQFPMMFPAYPAGNKSFLVLFFKKERFLFSLSGSVLAEA
jgi:uncharacterized protein YdhG (YjbR/CyaY superfamily)